MPENTVSSVTDRLAGRPLNPAVAKLVPRDMRRGVLTTALLCALLSGAFASKAAHAATDCFSAAAAYQSVNPLILRAIAWQESHDNVSAMHKNRNGSIDYGLMQINSIHLPKLAQYGISSDKLMDPCSNVYIAAWHLRRQMDKYGNSWAAVGAYHSETPTLRDQYAKQIIAILKRWNVIQSASR